MYTVRSGLAVVAALALGLTQAATAADKLLPDKSEIVVSINLKALAESDIAKKFDVEKHVRSLIKSQPQAQEVLTALNLDPFKDLHSITMGAAGLPMGGGDKLPDEAIVIVHGNFDLDRIQAALTAQAASNSGKLSISEQGRFKIYEFKEKQPMFALFVDNKTLVFSPKKESVVSASQKGSGQLNSATAGILAKINDKSSAWGVVAITGSLKDAIKNNPQAAAAANVEGLSFTLNVTSDAKLEILVHTTDAAAAKDLRAQAEAGFGIAKGFIQGNPDVPPAVGDIINMIRFGEKGNAVSINLDVSADAIQKIMDAAKSGGSKRADKKNN
jgi:hypothetical protein